MAEQLSTNSHYTVDWTVWDLKNDDDNETMKYNVLLANIFFIVLTVQCTEVILLFMMHLYWQNSIIRCPMNANECAEKLVFKIFTY